MPLLFLPVAQAASFTEENPGGSKVTQRRKLQQITFNGQKLEAFGHITVWVLFARKFLQDGRK